MKRTKIIATLGPATNNKDVLKRILQEGVDVIRLNGSHYRDKDNIKKDIDLIRDVSNQLSKHTAIFFDLQGPKIRVGSFEKDGVVLETGQSFSIRSEKDINVIIIRQVLAHAPASDTLSDITSRL